MSPVPKELAVFKKFDFERSPVGVKFHNIKPVGLKRPDKQYDFCEMLVEAQKGKAFYVTKDDFTCIGPMLLGMVDALPDFESGRVGPKLGVYRDERANRRMYLYLPKLAKGSVNYVSFAPLEKLTFEPDILIVLANPRRNVVGPGHGGGGVFLSLSLCPGPRRNEHYTHGRRLRDEVAPAIPGRHVADYYSLGQAPPDSRQPGRNGMGPRIFHPRGGGT